MSTDATFVNFRWHDCRDRQAACPIVRGRGGGGLYLRYQAGRASKGKKGPKRGSSPPPVSSTCTLCALALHPSLHCDCGCDM